MRPLWGRQRSAEPVNDTATRLVVGLGNPGREYERTRHNVGFMAVEAFAERHQLVFKASKQRADLARGSVAGVSLLLAEPLTFMNDSGIAVSRLMQYYKIDLSRLLIICDDIDLPFGTLRVRPDGSSGGQRGLESIIRELGSNDFARLRIGVGRPRSQTVSHVLGQFPPEQESALPGLLRITADVIELWTRSEVRDVMNRFNRDWLPEVAPSP